MISITRVISIANVLSNKPPPRKISHFTQSGVICWTSGVGEGDGDSDADDVSGGDSVVKVPTALQSP